MFLKFFLKGIELSINNKNFVVELSSDLDYEEMIAEILYKEETVAIISQELGIQSLKIELVASYDNKPWLFFLEDFLTVVESAKKQLIMMQKLPD